MVGSTGKVPAIIGQGSRLYTRQAKVAHTFSYPYTRAAAVVTLRTSFGPLATFDRFAGDRGTSAGHQYRTPQRSSRHECDFSGFTHLVKD